MKKIIAGLIIAFGTISMYSQAKPAVPNTPASVEVKLSEVDTLKFQLAQAKVEKLYIQVQAQMQQQIQNAPDYKTYLALVVELNTKYKATLNDQGQFISTSAGK